MPLELSDAELATAATARRAMAMENPGMRAPIDNAAKRFAALAENLEAARSQRIAKQRQKL